MLWIDELKVSILFFIENSKLKKIAYKYSIQRREGNVYNVGVSINQWWG
jgi:hypothetical protein